MDEHVPEHATNDHRYEIAADAALLGVWDWDVTTNAFFYSPRAREICGFAPDAEVTFEQILAATHPDDLPWTSALAERALNTEMDHHLGGEGGVGNSRNGYGQKTVITTPASSNWRCRGTGRRASIRS